MQPPHTHPAPVSATSTQITGPDDHTLGDTDDEYAWPTCTACHRDLWETETGRYACRACQDRASDHLRGIATLYPHLNTTSALTPRPSGDRARTGSRTNAPIPVALGVLDLTAIGGVATRLAAIEDAWRLALGRRIPVRHDQVRLFATWRANPAADVPQHVNFLRINLERACEQYPEIAVDLDEIRRLHDQCTAALRGALDPGERRPGPVPIGPCPTPLADAATGPAGTPATCGAPLTTHPGANRVHCPTCNTTWEGATAWIALRRAQNTHAPHTTAA